MLVLSSPRTLGDYRNAIKPAVGFSPKVLWLNFKFKQNFNCLYNSGFGRCTRYVWNKQKYIIWNHVAKIVYNEIENGLRNDTKLPYEHIQLTHYSVINV